MTDIETIGRHECMHLLAHRSFVGRVAFAVDGQPLVLPVNYVVDGTSVVFRTAAGTKLRALRGGARVAFEVDDGRPLDRAGWSVLVTGIAEEITDHRDLDRLRRGPLHSWAAPAADHWIRVTIDEVSGRRMAGS
jgi:nitroimidazol reductase NimA-like FMN-containing flavoprotein (pyridoxamine 5'-phosphate oxidase superfamily)